MTNAEEAAESTKLALDALDRAACELSIAAVLAPAGALGTDVVLLTEAIEAERACVATVLARLRREVAGGA